MCHADVVISHFDGVMMVSFEAGTWATMRRSTFSGNHVFDARVLETEDLDLELGDEVFAHAASCVPEDIVLTERNTVVALEDITFSSNSTLSAMVQQNVQFFNASIYHDMADAIGYDIKPPGLCSEEGAFKFDLMPLPHQKLTAIPRNVRPPVGDAQWMLDLQKVRLRAAQCVFMLGTFLASPIVCQM